MCHLFPLPLDPAGRRAKLRHLQELSWRWARLPEKPETPSGPTTFSTPGLSLGLLLERDVAQSGSAPQWGCGGPRFESGRPDMEVPGSASAGPGTSCLYDRIAEDAVGGSELWASNVAPGHFTGRMICARRHIRASRLEDPRQHQLPRVFFVATPGSLRAPWQAQTQLAPERIRPHPCH